MVVLLTSAYGTLFRIVKLAQVIRLSLLSSNGDENHGSECRSCNTGGAMLSTAEERLPT